jgi:hypothetical protein
MKQKEFAKLDWVSQNPQTDEDWALIGSLYQTRGGNGPGGGATQRIFERMQLTDQERGELTSGTAAGQLYYDRNGDGKVDDSNLPTRDSAFANASVVVPRDPSTPIPSDLYEVDGQLYQLSDRGGRNAGFVPLPADTTIEMNGKYYAYQNGELVSVDQPGPGKVTKTTPLGPKS